jgi:hypothetical protein
MIENIKIYGERNSGTHFLSSLLKNNIADNNVNFFDEGFAGGTGWKHGYPDFHLFDNAVLHTTLFVFIIRDKESWLKSMYNNPYHYKKPSDIDKFILNPLEVEESREDHPVFTEREKLNVIDLRYSKINSYLSFFKLVNNAIIINLTDLQNNTQKFLSFVDNFYKIRMKKETHLVKKHFKDSNLTVQNRTYDTVLPPIIKNNAILEDFVQKLKKSYYCKRS